MNQAVLQIPISKTLKTQAEIVARDYGSSLEDALRKIIAKFAKHELALKLKKPDLNTHLSFLLMPRKRLKIPGKEIYLSISKLLNLS